MRKHVGEKPHKSKQCKYTSTTFSDTLQIHMSTHTCEKPYKFDQCFTLVHKHIRCTRWHMLARRHTNDIGNDTIILIMIIAMIITAQRTQDIEYFDSFTTFSSKQKLQQALKSWSAGFCLSKGDKYIEQQYRQKTMFQLWRFNNLEKSNILRKIQNEK